MINSEWILFYANSAIFQLYHGENTLTCRKPFPHSWLVTRFVTRLTLVKQELPTLSEHPSSPPVFSGDRVAWSLVLCVCFVDLCLSFCNLSFGHCVVCSSLIYGFWLPLWYLQTLLFNRKTYNNLYFSSDHTYKMSVNVECLSNNH